MEPVPNSERLKNLSAEQRRKLWAKLARRKLTGHALIAEALRQCGVRRVSGITGKPLHQVFGMLVERGIRVIGTRHQTPATLQAATDNFLNDKLVHAVIVSAGPAITNTITGVLHARDNHWPLLVMGGRSPLQDEGKGHFQEMDAVPVFEPLTKWATAVRCVEEIMPALHKAVRTAIEGRPGPVYLDFPEDVLFSEALPVELPRLEMPEVLPVPAGTAEKARAIIASSRRPLICFGEELRRGFDRQVLQSLTGRAGIPFITTQQGRGLLPDSHPACMNLIRKEAMGRADCFVLAGSWFDWRLRMGAPLKKDARIIHVHEIAEELGTNVETVLAARGNPMRFLAELEKRFAGHSPLHLSEWHRELEALMATKLEAVASWRSPESDNMDSHAVMRTLKELLPPGIIQSVDGSLHLTIAQYHLQAEEPFSWFDPGWQGLIGGGIPFVMGSLLAEPDRPAVAIIGDMGFGLSCMEFDTAVRHNIPLKVIILNNSGISGQHRQNAFLPKDHPERFSRFQDNLPYEAIVRAQGAGGEAVHSIDDLPGAVGRMLASRSPYCLNLFLNPATPSPPVW